MEEKLAAGKKYRRLFLDPRRAKYSNCFYTLRYFLMGDAICRVPLQSYMQGGPRGRNFGISLPSGKNWQLAPKNGCSVLPYRICLAQAGALGLELGGAGRVSHQRVRLGRAGQRGVGDVGLRVRRDNETFLTISARKDSL